jgi:predicted transcriptional regulator
MKKFSLSFSEFNLASIIWDEEPIKSGELVKLAREKLDCKKSTTYTVLKKLEEKNIMVNNNSLVTSLVKKEEVQGYESKEFINKRFENSLPSFLTAFIGDNKISEEEAEELKNLIDSYKED